jgi:hypothetical protein
MKAMLALLVGVSLGNPTGSVWAEPGERSEPVAHTAASVLGTVAYTPLKGGLCLIGGGASLFAFLSSGRAAMTTMQQEACTGTWILTPEILTGDKPLNFLGEIPSP